MQHSCVPTISRRAWNSAVSAAALSLLVGGCQRRTKESTAIFHGLTVYVSTSGNDGWSGMFPTANQAQSDGPVASVQRAVEIVRQRRNAAKSTLTARILLRGGTYELRHPIIFAPEDSGTVEAPLLIAAYPDEKPIISGGVMITNWRKRDDGLWETHAPAAMDAATINELFVREHRKNRPRLPRQGWYFMAEMVAQQELRSRAFCFEKGQFNPGWQALRDIEVVSFESWTTERQWVHAVDPTNNTVYLQNSGHEFGTFEIRQRFYIDNVREALKEPGQWYFDRSMKTILYKPDSSDTLDDFSAVVPILRHLVEFRGSPARMTYVEHVTIQGVSFQYSACAVSRACLANDNQSATDGWEAAIYGHGVRNVKIVNCEISHGGEHAIRFMGANQRVIVQQCHIHDMGGGGIYLGLDCPIAEYYKMPAAARFTAECVVDNNFIHDSGMLFPQACGVWIGHSGDNRISHNVIMNLYYTGISIGWNWGTTRSPAVRNIVEFNRIYNLGNGVLSDGGGIYTLGVSPGTVLRNNWLSGLIPYNSQRMFNGLYLDEGSSQILVENNIVQQADGMGLLLNYGAKNRIQNNILDQTYGLQIERDTDSFGRRIPLSLTFERNVVVVSGSNILPHYSNAGWRFNRNVYWSIRGIAPTIHGGSFKQWQATGQDDKSLIGAPGLYRSNGSIGAVAGSPASRVGFQPIKISNIGLYGSAAWRTLPDSIQPLPIADRTNYYPRPKSETIHIVFRHQQEGRPPYDAVTWSNGNSIAAPTTLTRQKALRFGPHAVTYTYYQPWLRKCNLLLYFSILLPKHIGTTLGVELRDWRHNPYITGPSIQFQSHGNVIANGMQVGMIPLNQWVEVSIHYDYRTEALCRQYQISLRRAGKELASKRVQISGAAGFHILTWLGFINEGNIGQECYIGHVDCGPVAR